MEMIIGLLITLAFILIIVGVPIYVSLLLTGVLSLVALAASTGTPVATIAVSQAIFNGMGNLPLLAIPFFMLAGEIMNRGGITEKLIKFAMLLIGRLPGSLAHAGIVSSMFFGGITGSAQASASCMGGILIPAMEKEGYPVQEAAGIISAASVCGPIIPPSIIMVVYATAVGASVGSMFIGGVIPGIMAGLILMVIVLLRNRVCHFPRRTEKLTAAEIKKTLIDGIIPLGMPVIVVGGIMGGICTATEAGAIAVVYSLIVSLFITRTLKLREMGPILLSAANSAAPLLLIIACAKVFSYGLTALQMPVLVNDLILSITDNKWVFLLLVNLFLLLMGMFFDTTAALIIFPPLLLPAALALGINPIHFGIIICINITIGGISPPFGVVSFAVLSVCNAKMGRYIRQLTPFLAALLIVLALVTFVEPVSMFLPSLLGS